MAQHIDTRLVFVKNLKPGMYVALLDRPWLETPFPLQGFVITDQREIDKLSMFCEHVFVDVKRSTVKPDYTRKVIDEAGRRKGISHVSLAKELSSRKIVKYEIRSSVTEEVKIANETHNRLREEFDAMADTIAKGHALDVEKLQESVDPLVDSIMRNPNANIWLARLKSKDTYTYRHCISVAIWCTVIGRQIGLPKKELQYLSTGGMLLDIGKLLMPDKLLNKHGKLSKREFELMKKHVDLGLQVVKNSVRLAPQPVRDMIEYHHERFNGEGYYKGLKGVKIPLYARIAAIADCYDAITSHRVYADPIPHAQAVKQMYDWRDYDFQAELVEAFIQAIGIYPTGTMVELVSGEVGVVIKENKARRLKPEVLLILDKEKQMLDSFREVDLSRDASSTSQSFEILRTLEAGAYGLDPEMLYI